MTDKVAVLCHGFLGDPGVFGVMKKGLQANGFRVYTPDVTGSGWVHATIHGVKYCGDILTDFMIDSIPNDVNLYMIGHSFGGVYMRHTIGSLHKRGVFERKGWVPKMFLTTASPHAGVYGFPELMKVIGSNVCELANDLFLHNTTLIEISRDEYKEGLARFERRVLIGDILMDKMINPVSAFLTANPQSEAYDLLSLTNINASKALIDSTAALDVHMSGTGLKTATEVINNMKDVQFQRFATNINDVRAHHILIAHPKNDPEQKGVPLVASIVDVITKI